MQDKIKETVTLQEIADHVNLSQTHFLRLFKKRMNHTPIDYFIRLKIQHACHYLELTNMSAQDVALILGYEDPYYFSRIFKRVMGIPPQKYRIENPHQRSLESDA